MKKAKKPWHLPPEEGSPAETTAQGKTLSDTCPGRMVRLCGIGRVEGGRDRPGAQILAAHSEGAAGAG